MIVAQISDFHITKEGTDAYGKVPTSANLIHCVKHINKLNPAADVVLVPGDITNEGLAEETEQAKSILDT